MWRRGQKALQLRGIVDGECDVEDSDDDQRAEDNARKQRRTEAFRAQGGRGGQVRHSEVVSNGRGERSRRLNEI